jgi:hypothetical protein
MHKIPTLFQRNPDDMRHVTRDVNPSAQWVLDGEAVATRKFDGTCVMLDDAGRWWARREVKRDKPFPAGYLQVETDPNTGKTVGWEPIEQSPFAKTFASITHQPPTTPGTYELVGPKVNGNPEGNPDHRLVPHGQFRLDDVPLDYDGLAELLGSWDWEGIVWHHPDGRMAKLKRRDFPVSVARRTPLATAPHNQQS